MSLCAVYKSPVKEQCYLYINKRDDFSQVPEALLQTFGKPQFVMMLVLREDKAPVAVSFATLSEALAEKGYFLQLPPPPINYLQQHKERKQAKE